MLASPGGSGARAGVLKDFSAATLSGRMSSRQEEKERRRRERLEREQAERAKAARGKRLQIVIGVVVALVLAAGATAIILTTLGGDDTETEAPAGSANIPPKQQGDLKKAVAAAGCTLKENLP